MIFVLDPVDPNAPFPSVALAEQEPNGLLAIGGDLRPERLLNAYRSGIFPWYSDDQPILWWSPDPRTVLYPERIRVSRSLRKTLRNKPFRITMDQAFSAVIDGCAAPRVQQKETWITPEMRSAYRKLHRLGHAHSVEIWLHEQLVGGLYGVAVGRVFFGESMFSSARDASKVALVHLAQTLSAWHFGLIDCQVHSTHLISLGAEQIGRAAFCSEVEKWSRLPGVAGDWGDLGLAGESP